MRALRGDGKCDARRLGQQVANPVDDNFVGVAHPLAQMHELEPGFHSECLQEAPGVADVFINAPGVGSVPPSRVSQFVDCAEELGLIGGVDAVFHHHI